MCTGRIDSVYHKEYTQGDQGSESVLRQVNKIVSSSTDFKQVAGCAQFSAKWAYMITWLDIVDSDSTVGICNTVSLDSVRSLIQYYIL